MWEKFGHPRKLFFIIDRRLSGNFMKQFCWIFFIVSIILIILGLLGWWAGADHPYKTFIHIFNPQYDFGLNPEILNAEAIGTPSHLQRIIGFIITMIGSLLLTGLLTTTLINWVDRRKERWQSGEARYHITKDFVAIIGTHKMVSNLCNTLLSKGDIPRWIVILGSRDTDEVRKEIFESLIDKNHRKRIVVYKGDRSSKLNITSLNPEKAREIYIIGENFPEDGFDHDTVNLETYYTLSSYIAEKACNDTKRKRIKCHVMFEYQSTFTAFQYFDIDKANCHLLDFIPFNYYENWAQQVLVPDLMSQKPNIYKPLYDTPIDPKSKKRVHLIIAGMSKMGVAMAIEAAQVAHFPNFSSRGVRTLITFIDRNAAREMTFFKGRFSNLFEISRHRYVNANQLPSSGYSVEHFYDANPSSPVSKAHKWLDPMNDVDSTSRFKDENLGDNIVDIDWEFIEGDISNPNIRSYLIDAASDPDSVTNLAICLPVTPEAVSAAIYLPEKVLLDSHQILVQQSTTDALVSAIRKGSDAINGHPLMKLVPFGMIDRSNYDTEKRDLLAKLINYTYGLGPGEDLSKIFSSGELRLNDVEKSWSEMKGNKGKPLMSMRWSNMYHASAIYYKIGSLGIQEGAEITTEQLAQLARMEHLRWNVEQLMMGFRPQLSSDSRFNSAEELRRNMIHYDIKDFDHLPEETRDKDNGFSRNIPMMLKALRYFDPKQYTFEKGTADDEDDKNNNK